MDIRPFRGWRYAARPDEDISNRIAPPYDVLDGADKEALLTACGENIVAADLPHVPPKEVGPEEAYEAAASLLDRWRSSGILKQDERPCLYVYEQGYTCAGREHVRRSLIAGVRATPLGEDVLPHEHTFAGPKADRLLLTERTRTQLSCIFGFYEEPSGTVAGVLAEAAKRAPDLAGTLNGVSERLWALDDEEAIASIQETLSETPVFIADGHHRYTTAVNYRDALEQAGRIDADHEANFVMFALTERHDPGLVILPTHRVVRGLRDVTVEKLREALPAFELTEASLGGADLGDADAFLEPHGPGAMGLLFGGEPELLIARLRDPDAMTAAAPDRHESWRNLDVAVLHTLILDGGLTPFRTDATEVTYTPDGNAARDACTSDQADLAVLLQGTPIDAVEQVALAEESMPHKSTYFYPKIATGMVLKPLE